MTSEEPLESSKSHHAYTWIRARITLELVNCGWSRLSGLRHSTFEFVPGRARDSVAEHSRILDLIRAGADPLEIDRGARLHRWRTLDAFLAARHPDPDLPDPDGRTHS